MSPEPKRLYDLEMGRNDEDLILLNFVLDPRGALSTSSGEDCSEHCRK